MRKLQYEKVHTLLDTLREATDILSGMGMGAAREKVDFTRMCSVRIDVVYGIVRGSISMMKPMSTVCSVLLMPVIKVEVMKKE